MNADITSGWAGAGGAAAPPADPLIQLSDVTKSIRGRRASPR